MKTKSATKRRLSSIAIAVTLVVVLGSGPAAAAWWLGLPWRDVGGPQPSPGALELRRVRGTHWDPTSGQPLFILLLGCDARGDSPDHPGRADAIHLVAINPGLKTGTVLNFPRDSAIEAPKYGSGKLNALYVYGGPELLIQYLMETTHIPIHYYAQLGFSHFTGIVDELGGIDVQVPYAIVNDKLTGANFPAGNVHMSGKDALLYLQCRAGTPQGDLSRIDNRIRMIKTVVRKLVLGLLDRHTAVHDLDVVRRHVKTDVPLSELSAIAWALARVDVTRVNAVTVPAFEEGTGEVHLSPGDMYRLVATRGFY
jgi:polyisoprenyl-teichoic acid--peptidoglycan teichoic acid transferase